MWESWMSLCVIQRAVQKTDTENARLWIALQGSYYQMLFNMFPVLSELQWALNILHCGSAIPFNNKMKQII